MSFYDYILKQQDWCQTINFLFDFSETNAIEFVMTGAKFAGKIFMSNASSTFKGIKEKIIEISKAMLT